MSTEQSDGRAARLLDGAAIALFAAHAALRMSLRGGDGAWGSNLSTHLLVPLAAAVWLTARALEKRLPWRLTGLEIPLAALAGLALISVYGASYRLGAMDGAAGLVAAILAVPLAVHMFGPQGRGALTGLLCAIVAVVALYGGLQYVQLGELRTAPEASQAIASAEDPGELEGRIKAREPMSTLNYPNTFAGFLVLSLPFVLGFLLDARSKAALPAGILILAVGGFCLWATGSVGARVAAIVAACAFGILEVIRRKPHLKRRILIACGAALALILILVAVGPLSPNSLAKKSEAIAIRDVYWDAALRVAKANPFGVGLNNFEDNFYEHKDDRQEEVRHVHNDYLQFLSELGIPGLLAFLFLLAFAFRAALGPASTEPAESPGTSRIPVISGLAIGWLIAFGLQGTFGSFATALLLAAAGLAAYWIFAGAARPGEFTRIGLAAGLAGAAVHMLVDFDLWDPSFRHYFFLSLAALVLAARLEPPGIARTVVPAIGAAVLFAIAIPLGAAVAPRFLEAEELASNAVAAEERNRDDEADASWEQAAAANRLDPAPAVRGALRVFQRWSHAIPGKDPAAETRGADLVITILEDALRRRPRYASIEARLAEVHEAVARRMRERGVAGGSIEAAAAQAHAQEAERHARRAVELYPTRSYHQYLLGRILDAAGNEAEAATAFREAIRLSSLAKRVPRLGLDGVQFALAASRTGADPARVAAIFREWHRVQEQRPVLAARWRARIPLLTPEEKSIVDAAAESK